MPYLIETKTPARDRIIGEQWHHVSYRAVATLGEAREMVSTTVCDLMAGENFGQYQDQFRAIDEAGGKVGPLNDDTVIEVAPITLAALAGSPVAQYNDRHTAEIIAAYNAAQQED